jgi:CheY-like chemotaxis protein
MGERREKRTPLKTQVRVFGTDSGGTPFSRLAETIDVSPSSVRLAGVYVGLRPQAELELESEAGSGRFRVVWQGKIGTALAGEVALRLADPNVILWPTDEPDWQDTFDPNAAAPERRFYRRFECELPAYVVPEGQTAPTVMKCVDLGFGGCYLQTDEPLQDGTKLRISLASVMGQAVSASAFVRSVHCGYGMGVRFTQIDDPRALAALLENLRPPKAHRRQRTAAAMATVDEKADRAARTILVVDDSLSIRNLAGQHLRRHGYNVVVAKDGEEGLAVARANQPDMILLDVLLPRLSGLAVLRQLKADATTSHIPVVVVSSLPEDNDARMLAEGACGYVAKASTPPERLPRVVDRTFEYLTNQTVAAQ